MMEWKTLMTAVGIVSLCFLAIPIRLGPENTEHDIKLFESYVEKYDKPYKHIPAEYGDRFKNFQISLRYIRKMNSMRSSEESAVYGITPFSDMSEDEFSNSILRRDLSSRAMVHLHRGHHSKHGHPEVNRVKRTFQDIPLKFDWREKGFVTTVRSQGRCGACWAFSTIEVAESMFAIKNGSLFPLSVQEMIDCAGNSNFGCDGGDVCSLLTWLTATGVEIQLESSYPLTWTTNDCALNEETETTDRRNGVRVTSFSCDSFVDAEDDLITTIARYGPVAAAVNALSWQNYLGGVIQFHCDGLFSSLNHAVQVVGYDRSGPIPFYIVRNSWGPSFGNKGYLYIAVGSNLCGIANQVSSVEVT